MPEKAAPTPAPTPAAMPEAAAAAATDSTLDSTEPEIGTESEAEAPAAGITYDDLAAADIAMPGSMSADGEGEPSTTAAASTAAATGDDGDDDADGSDNSDEIPDVPRTSDAASAPAPAPKNDNGSESHTDNDNADSSDSSTDDDDNEGGGDAEANLAAFQVCMYALVQVSTFVSGSLTLSLALFVTAMADLRPRSNMHPVSLLLIVSPGSAVIFPVSVTSPSCGWFER